MNRFSLVYYIIISLLLISFTHVANAELLDSWEDERAYKPIPVLLLHGFASGSPSSWIYLASYLAQYYNPYQDLDPVFLDPVTEERLSYLERIDFQDPNGSIDRYDPGEFNPQGNSAGWADKVEIAVNDMLDVNHYGSYCNKVILICHSMGGLAAREYITAVGAGNVAKLVTLNTPHAGSPLANFAQIINKSRAIARKIPSYGWGYSATVSALDGYINWRRDIDIDGEAVKDMAIGSDFLRELNSRAQPSEEALPNFAISAYMNSYSNRFFFHPYYPNLRTALNPIDSGDEIVPIDSQEGFDVITDPGLVRQVWQFDEIERITGGHSDALHDVPLELPEGNIDSTFDKILQWIDSEPPEVEITGVKIEEDGVEEDAPFEDGAYLLVGSTNCILEGVVRKEFFPASSNVIIEAYRIDGEEPFEIWRDVLKPDDSWIRNDPESIVAGFKEEIEFPGFGIYTVKVKVTNPVGISNDDEIITVIVRRQINVVTHCIADGGYELNDYFCWSGEPVGNRVYEEGDSNASATFGGSDGGFAFDSQASANLDSFSVATNATKVDLDTCYICESFAGACSMRYFWVTSSNGEGYDIGEDVSFRISGTAHASLTRQLEPDYPDPAFGPDPNNEAGSKVSVSISVQNLTPWGFIASAFSDYYDFRIGGGGDFSLNDSKTDSAEFTVSIGDVICIHSNIYAEAGISLYGISASANGSLTTEIESLDDNAILVEIDE